MKIIKYFFLVSYYTFFIFLPTSTTPIIGKKIEIIRTWICKMIFRKVGYGANVEKGARFGNGFQVEIGEKSSIGKNCKVPNNIIIGDYVMMGNNVTIFSSTHVFNRVDVPMLKQGIKTFPPFIIEDDVWLGQNVLIMGKVGKISKGTIVGAGSVVTKSFPAYSIIGGNPAKQIGTRLNK